MALRRWWKAVFLAAAMMVFAAGCMDYEEEITLKQDGSGTVVVHYSMDESMAQMMEGEETPFSFDKEEIEQRFQGAPVRLSKVDVYTKDEQRHAVLVIEFPHLEKLQGSWPFEDRTITLTRQEDGTIEYRTVIKMDEAEEPAGAPADDGTEERAAEEETLSADDETDESESVDDAEMEQEMAEAAAEMAKAALAGHFFKYTLNVPGEIVKASDGGTINGRQVTWELPLEKLDGMTEIVMSVVYKA